MGKIKQELVTFGKAELTASIASIVDFGLAFFLSDIIGIYYGLANATLFFLRWESPNT